VEVREDIADQVAEIVADSMKAALERIIPEVPFVVEPRVAEAWR
jgi:DNA polymerase I-like protein with 3'-5' exonuclease and polymerase domains